MSEALSPAARDPRRPFVAAPFTRLARAHAFSVGGDALFTIGLAGSVFFAVNATQARPRVALTLLLTFAPFAAAAPFIGPLLDRIRGGRRWMIVATLALRAFMCVLIVRDLNKPPFYIEAFLVLVLSKAYLISRAAVVPTTVRSDRELVEANSKLALLSGVAAVVAAIPAGLLLWLGGKHLGPQLVVGVATVVFAIGAGFATRLPKVRVAVVPRDEVEKEELRSAGIRLAASAMTLLRAAVGVLVLLVAFAFKHGDMKAWGLALCGLGAQAGVLIGAALAPRLRLAFSEARIITGSLAVTLAAAVIAVFIGGPGGAILLSLVLGITGGTAKQSFDALVQRDAPDANRGRSFARFETRFQLAWVLGALVPLAVQMPLVVGYVLCAVLMVIGLVGYLLGQRRVAGGTYDWESPGQRLIRRGRRLRGADDAVVDPTTVTAAADDTALAPRPDPTMVTPPPPPPPAPTPASAPAPAATATAGAGPLPPPPRAGAARSSTATWMPPAGFVSRGLNDDPIPGDEDATTVGTAAPGETGPDIEQPTLPLDFESGAGSTPAAAAGAVEADPDATPTEPRWRNS